MTDPVLLEELLTFPLDTTKGRPSFHDRLRLSCGWSSAYATRVENEYRRFLYIAATSPEPVWPSPDVDEVWQLHLSYTQSYWEELCMRILKRPLHHQPGWQGREQRARRHVWYDRTLRRYQLEFGNPAPAPVWCEPAALFGPSRIICERVNLKRYWIVPKPEWNLRTLALLTPALLVPAVAGALDWVSGMVAAGLALLGLLAAALIADHHQRRGLTS